MKNSLLSTFALVGTFTFLAQPVDANTLGCITGTVDYSKDYFPDKVSPTYSKNWDISYHNTYKIFTNKEVGKSYLMYQCGTEPPASEEGKHAFTFSVPLQDGVVVTSNPMIGHLEQLGLRRQIKGYDGNTTTISSPCLSSLIDDGAIKLVHDGNSWVINGDDVDVLLAQKPETVVLRGSDYGNNTFVVSEYKEAENLDIYEWQKAYGALFNLEVTANELFEEAEARYLCNANNAKVISEERRLDNTEATKPTIVWAQYSTYGGTPYWDVVNCNEKNLYYCEYAQLCSAELLHSNNGTIANTWTEGDYHMNDQEFFDFAKDADHFIYAGKDWDATFEKFKTELSGFKSVKNMEVYDTQGSGKDAWFEQRFAEFDIVLQDFCDVVGHYDNANSPPHTRKYFRKTIPADAEPVPEKGVCELQFVDLPFETRASSCVTLQQKPNLAITMSSQAALFISLMFSTLMFFN